MTRGSMRTLLRQYIGDTEAVSFTTTELDGQLNLSVQEVALSLAQSRPSTCQTIVAPTTTYTTSTAGTSLLSLSAYTNIHTILQVHGLGYQWIGEQVSPEEMPRSMSRGMTPTTRDGLPSYPYVVHIDPSSYNFSLEFAANPPGAVVVRYAHTIAALTVNNGTADSSTFAGVPPVHHIRVVEHAALILLGYDGTETTGFAAQNYGVSSVEMVRDTKRRAGAPSTVT